MRLDKCLLLLLLVLCTGIGATTIYDIQYTSSRGADNCYPSPYLGKTVTVEGVVTATNYRSGGYFISEPVSGAWRGILINDSRHNPRVGNYLRITGVVAEIFGMTCIQDLSDYRLLDSNRSLPNPVTISTGQLASSFEAEAYEGVYARLINVSSSSGKSRNNRFMVNDGSGQCSIVTGSFGGKAVSSPAAGVQYSQIVGVVVFGYGEFSLNPISAGDISIQQPASVQNRSWGKIKSIYK
jgi:hypothetical protein